MSYAEYCYAGCHFAKCHYAGCDFAEMPWRHFRQFVKPCPPLFTTTSKRGHLITNQQTKTLCGGFLNEISY